MLLKKRTVPRKPKPKQIAMWNLGCVFENYVGLRSWYIGFSSRPHDIISLVSWLGLQCYESPSVEQAFSAIILKHDTKKRRVGLLF